MFPITAFLRISFPVPDKPCCVFKNSQHGDFTATMFQDLLRFISTMHPIHILIHRRLLTFSASLKAGITFVASRRVQA